MATPIRIALLGTGTVGGGVISLLKRNRTQIAKKHGIDLQICCAVARNTKRARTKLAKQIPITSNWEKAIRDYNCDIVVELIGGKTDALQCALATAAAGLPLVTANKALLATHGHQILAKTSKTGLYFEAAVAGCIPIIRTLNESLAGDQVLSIQGIVNGTCNYILSQMASNGCSFAESLVQAQQLGFAEADPTFDIKGIDAAHKAVLMAWLAFGGKLTMQGIPCQGISQIDPLDESFAEGFDYRIKLIAQVTKQKEGIEIWVGPALVADQNLLARIDGSMNAVVVNSTASGTLSLIGAGAGAEPTASAVVADLVECGLDLKTNQVVNWPKSGEVKFLPLSKRVAQAYLRLDVIDKPGIMAAIATILTKKNISIEAIKQPESKSGEQVSLVFLLHEAPWQSVVETATRIKRLKLVRTTPILMPIAVPHVTK